MIALGGSLHLRRDVEDAEHPPHRRQAVLVDDVQVGKAAERAVHDADVPEKCRDIAGGERVGPRCGPPGIRRSR